MRKAAITSIWDWSAPYLAVLFLLHQHFDDDETIALWIDKDNIHRVYMYDELSDDGFIEYYIDGIARGVWTKEDVRRHIY